MQPSSLARAEPLKPELETEEGNGCSRAQWRGLSLKPELEAERRKWVQPSSMARAEPLEPKLEAAWKMNCCKRQKAVKAAP